MLRYHGLGCPDARTSGCQATHGEFASRPRQRIGGRIATRTPECVAGPASRPCWRPRERGSDRAWLVARDLAEQFHASLSATLSKLVAVDRFAIMIVRHGQAGRTWSSLIIAPASLIANWAAEAERLAPSLSVFVARPAFTPAELLKSTSAEDLVGIDLVVTSYAALLRLDWLGKTRWRLAVVDEAQAIKRRPARSRRRSREVPRRRRQGPQLGEGPPI